VYRVIIWVHCAHMHICTAQCAPSQCTHFITRCKYTVSRSALCTAHRASAPCIQCAHFITAYSAHILSHNANILSCGLALKSGSRVFPSTRMCVTYDHMCAQCGHICVDTCVCTVSRGHMCHTVCTLSAHTCVHTAHTACTGHNV